MNQVLRSPEKQIPFDINIAGDLLQISEALVKAGFLGFETLEEFVTSAIRSQVTNYFLHYPEARKIFREWRNSTRSEVSSQ